MVKKKKKRKTLVIKRSKWGKSALYNPRTKRMCCMGFYCEQFHGTARDTMADEAVPLHVGVNLPKDSLPGLHKLIPRAPGDASDDLLSVANDCYRGKKREELIRLGFAEMGIQVRFID